MSTGFGKRAVAVLGPASPDLVDVLRRLGLEPYEDDGGGATLWLPAERPVVPPAERSPGAGARDSKVSPMLLTIAEAAAALGVGRSTLYEMIARREIQIVHLGRAARVPRQAVEELVERLRRDVAV